LKLTPTQAGVLADLCRPILDEREQLMTHLGARSVTPQVLGIKIAIGITATLVIARSPRTRTVPSHPWHEVRRR
jgi:hypothetical protein